MANINRDKDKQPEPYEPVDFMPDFWDETIGEPQGHGMSERATLAMMKALMPPMPTRG